MVIDLGIRAGEIPAALGRGAFLSPEGWDALPHPPLAEAGYGVREFIVSGAARVFADAEGEASTSRPYATRVLVIAPVVDADFSGVVHIELLNPSTGEDFPMFWPDAGFRLMERGDAYVGVTCKSATVEALRERDPQRYAGLHIAHDSAVWDLLGAVAAACRLPEAGGLLPGLRAPERRLATGWSQSGSFLRTYLSERIHEEHSALLEAEVIDGYLIGVSSGGFGPMGYVERHRDGEIAFDASFRPLTENAAQLAMDDARRFILEPPVPVIEYMSEDEAVQHLWHRRPDSDVPGDRYRCYQVPARGHETGLLPTAYRASELGLADPDEFAAFDPPPHPSSRWLIAAAIEHLVAWDETAPPRADPLPLRVADGFVRDPHGVDYTGVTTVADGEGHARGGLRHLEVEAPIARWRTDADGPMTMRRWVATSLSPDELAERYGTAGEFEHRTRVAARRLVDGGWLLPEHRDAAVAAHVAAFRRACDRAASAEGNDDVTH